MRKYIIFIGLILIASAFKMVDEVEDPQKCIEEKCPNQWAACQKDSKCISALQDCQKRCGTSSSCWTLCLPTKGSQAAIDVAKCAQANGCDKAKTEIALRGPQECIEKFCKKEEQLCENDRRCIATLNFCDQRCNTNLTCWKDCLDRAKEQNATNYINCIVQNNCLNATQKNALVLADPQKCIQEKCPNQWAACQKDSKCIPALQDCQKKCGTKTSCWSLCLTTHGSQAAIDVAKCAQANGCLSSPLQNHRLETALMVFTPQQCIQQYCSTQAQNCQKDRGCLAALQDCERECKDNQTCWSTCLAKKGNSPATALWKCILDNDCLNKIQTAVALADPIDCIKQKCPNQWAACQKDSKCVPTLQDCQKKCGTKTSCWTLCLTSHGDQPAINVAKCAQANGCLSSPAKETHPFIQCMQKSCVAPQLECLYNKQCSRALTKCVKRTQYDFDYECLYSEAKESEIVGAWYSCAGEHFCL